MEIRDLMSTPVTTVTPDTPVFDARDTMLHTRIRHLLVVDDGRLIGIVTDRDIRLNLPSPATSLSIWEINHLLMRLTVAEVMTKGVITVTADRDPREAARLMVDHRIGALPVVEDGRPVGILTESDLLRAYAADVAFARA